MNPDSISALHCKTTTTSSAQYATHTAESANNMWKAYDSNCLIDFLTHIWLCVAAVLIRSNAIKSILHRIGEWARQTSCQDYLNAIFTGNWK